MTKTKVPFDQQQKLQGNFPIQNIGGLWTITRQRPRQLVIFETNTEAKAMAFLEVYATLSIEDRRKLREACK